MVKVSLLSHISVYEEAIINCITQNQSIYSHTPSRKLEY